MKLHTKGKHNGPLRRNGDGSFHASARSIGKIENTAGGLPARKPHCSAPAEEAFKTAIKDYYNKNGIAYEHNAFPDEEACEECRMM